MSFVPTNELETALVEFRALTLPLNRFLPILLAAQIQLPSKSAVTSWEAFEPLLFPRGDMLMAACFSSPERAENYRGHFSHMIQVRMLDFLIAMRAHAGVVLNPGQEKMGYELFPDGIAEIVKHAK
ncbi:MAG: hypothetical protein JWP35_3291 [Caulobacter sp.]|nr:hypothetical protein [Caulobacter sp.]